MMPFHERGILLIGCVASFIHTCSHHARFCSIVMVSLVGGFISVIAHSIWESLNLMPCSLADFFIIATSVLVFQMCSIASLVLRVFPWNCRSFLCSSRYWLILALQEQIHLSFASSKRAASSNACFLRKFHFRLGVLVVLTTMSL